MKTLLSISFAYLLFLPLFGISQTKQLDLGDKMPFFSLPNQDGKTINIKDLVGSKELVIFFYPKEENILCKKEVCAFSDSISKFNAEGALVIGISDNDVKKIKKFHDENKLKYDLLSDPDGAILKKLGIKEKLLSKRITYVVNISGTVVFKTYSFTDGKKHVAEALKFLRQAE